MPDPYTMAASAYRRGGETTLDHRSLEASVLLTAANRLEALRRDWQPSLADDLDAALLHNRKIWTIFASEAADGADRLPADLRNNIASLSLFVFRRSIDLQIAPEPRKIDALVQINRTIAAGLLSRPETPTEQQKDAATAPRAAASV
jgi:flagellar biosynthesis activator protein FlaF